MYFKVDIFSYLTSFKIAQYAILIVHMITFVFNFKYGVIDKKNKYHSLKITHFKHLLNTKYATLTFKNSYWSILLKIYSLILSQFSFLQYSNFLIKNKKKL